MATFIDARRRDGEIVFRLWYTVLDVYLHEEPMSEVDLRQHLLFDDLCDAARNTFGVAPPGYTFGEELRAALWAVAGKLLHDFAIHPGNVLRVCEDRIARAKERGTSERIGPDYDLDGPWRTS